MAYNFLEQLVAEWYEYKGYFVRRNINVGILPRGGYECELDVVVFNPLNKHLVHIEPSMDASSWAQREARYRKKFRAGRRHIPSLFVGLELPDQIEQIALLGYANRRNHATLAGGRIVLISDLLIEILQTIKDVPIPSSAIPEDKPLLRMLQFVSANKQEIMNVFFPTNAA